MIERDDKIRTPEDLRWVMREAGLPDSTPIFIVPDLQEMQKLAEDNLAKEDAYGVSRWQKIVEWIKNLGRNA